MTFPEKSRALITGASSGIGRATALAFAQAGIEVALVSRSKEALEAVASEIRQQGGTGHAYPLDLAQIDRVKSDISVLINEFGPVDILVNSAGMGYTNSLLETSLQDWQQVLNLNLTSVFQCIQAVLPGMQERRRGTILNIASIAGTQAFPEWGAYSVSKAGLIMLSKSLAVEARSYGIRVITISPGAVNTPIWDTGTVQADFDRSQMLTPDIVAQTILHAALLPPSAVIEDLTVMPSAGAL